MTWKRTVTLPATWYYFNDGQKIRRLEVREYHDWDSKVSYFVTDTWKYRGDGEDRSIPFPTREAAERFIEETIKE